MTPQHRPAVERRHDDLGRLEEDLQRTITELRYHTDRTPLPTSPRHYGELVPHADLVPLRRAMADYERAYRIYETAHTRHHRDGCCI